MATEKYDLLILGSGEGDKYLAWTMARLGQRVAVVERKYIGGSCPNIACLPSKNIIHSAKVAQYVRQGAEFGANATDLSIDMSAVRERKRHMVNDLIDIHLKNYRSSCAELVMGNGRFIAPRTMQVTGSDGSVRVLEGTNVVIGSGTYATLPDIPGLHEASPLTHIEALELDTVPDHLLVLGGGYVGLELAQAFRRFGSRVTVMDRNGRLLPREDPDVSAELEALLRDEEIEFIAGAQTTGVRGKSGDSVQVTFAAANGERTLTGSHLLVAAGRTPNTAGIGLDVAGVELRPDGYIKVNEKLQTTAEGVWAVGEVAGSPQFTHAAFDDFRVIRDNLTGQVRTTTNRQMPFCMFTDPELARVGLSEAEAKAQGIAYRRFKLPMTGVLRARTLGEMRGFLKAVVAVDSDRILGFTAFGVDAGETMAIVQIAMLAGLQYTALRDAVLTHPTVAEGLVFLFMSQPADVRGG